MTKIQYRYNLLGNRKIVIASVLAIMTITTTVTAISPVPIGDGLGPMTTASTEDPVESVQETLQAFCEIDDTLLSPVVECPQGFDTSWSAFHDGYGWKDEAKAIIVSSEGSTIYVTGDSRTGSSLNTQDIVTVAYNDEGNELWVARYDGPESQREIAWDIGLSPDGERVYVTGRTDMQDSSYDYATIAYRATTGEELWTATYDGPGQERDEAFDLAVSPSGDRIFVTGGSRSSTSQNSTDYATIAYNAATGAQDWVARYNGPADDFDLAVSVAANPDGSLVFVTGRSESETYTRSPNDVATVAYDAASGAEVWAVRYDGGFGESDGGTSIAVSPDGTTVYVTGSGRVGDDPHGFLTLAYEASTGSMLWKSNAGGNISAMDIVLNADGTRLFIVGMGRLASSSPLDVDFVTTSIDAETGAEEWTTWFDGADGLDLPGGIDITPDGATVFVSGWRDGGSGSDTYDYVTLAYEADSGSELAVELFDHGRKDASRALAVSPTGDRVYVTGFAQDTGYGDFGTIAYAWG